MTTNHEDENEIFLDISDPQTDSPETDGALWRERLGDLSTAVWGVDIFKVDEKIVRSEATSAQVNAALKGLGSKVVNPPEDGQASDKE